MTQFDSEAWIERLEELESLRERDPDKVTCSFCRGPIADLRRQSMRALKVSDSGYVIWCEACAQKRCIGPLVYMTGGFNCGLGGGHAGSCERVYSMASRGAVLVIDTGASFCWKFARRLKRCADDIELGARVKALGERVASMTEARARDKELECAAYRWSVCEGAPIWVGLLEELRQTAQYENLVRYAGLSDIPERELATTIERVRMMALESKRKRQPHIGDPKLNSRASIGFRAIVTAGVVFLCEQEPAMACRWAAESLALDRSKGHCAKVFGEATRLFQESAAGCLERMIG